MPLSVESRLSKLSSDGNVFIQAASLYQETLKRLGTIINLVITTVINIIAITIIIRIIVNCNDNATKNDNDNNDI